MKKKASVSPVAVPPMLKMAGVTRKNGNCGGEREMA